MIENIGYVTIDEDWICPACTCKTNTQGTNFSGSRAVVLHISGKLRAWSRLHQNWAIKRIDEKICYDPWEYPMNSIARELEPYVIEENKKRLNLEKEKIERLIRQRETREEPRVLAFRYIEDIETKLHQFVRTTLQKSFGYEEIE